MRIRRQLRCGCRLRIRRRKHLLLNAFFFVLFLFTVYLFTLPSYVHINLNEKYQNIKFTSKDVYLLNGIAYDFYSLNELTDGLKPGVQWKTFPLPNEQIPANITPWIPNHDWQDKVRSNVKYPSSQAATGLAFVDHIYITTAVHLTDRQVVLRKMFRRYRLKNYEWRMTWTRKRCVLPEYKNEIYTKMNLKGNHPLSSKIGQRLCPVTMEHVDTWYDIVARNSSLSLILEDDAVFVPNFAEKFNRTIYTAIRTGALRIGGLSLCANSRQHLSIDSDEWFDQDPVISIGGCMNVHDRLFDRHQIDATPMLSTHKRRGGRCSHAYLLTACSARALIRQIAGQINRIVESDIFLDQQVAASPTLQSFWLDPPLSYQGNQIDDLDSIPSFNKTTY